MIDYLKEAFSTIYGQASFVRLMVGLVLAPVLAIFWIEAGYILIAGHGIAIDGNVVALFTAAGGIVAGIFAYARTLESKDPAPPSK